MYIKREILSKIPTESFLIGILRLIGLLSWYHDADKGRGRPYVYPTTVMIRCFVVRIWFRIPSNNCLHHYFSSSTRYNKKIMKSCGLHTLPDRRTFDRRFKALPVRDVICTMGKRFVTDHLVDASITSVDSSIVTAKGGKVWHKKDIISNTIPTHGIDTDARWGFSATKGWRFGYKIHLVCSTGRLVVPLSAGVSTANVQDNQLYCDIISLLPDCLRYVAGDGGYDDWKLYYFTKQRNARLVCPVKRYRHTKKNRLELIRFYKSRKGHSIYRRRGVSIEPLFECIKGTFGISTAPVVGFENVSSYLLMCIFVYQIAVYHNCIIGSDRPRRIRNMLGN